MPLLIARWPARPPNLVRARELIDARYDEPLGIPALARAASLSPAHFNREFRRVFGTTPHRYLVARRMERAAELLLATDDSVRVICRAVGLWSLGSFTTSFRLTHGLPPAAYRRAQREAARPERSA